MNIEDLRAFLLSLPNVEEVNPFDEDAGIVIYKIGGKWFAAYNFERPESIAVKCDPDRAVALRERSGSITPAWHFNKRHWNDLSFGRLRAETVRREICHSYLTVIRKNVTPKALREQLAEQAAAAGVTDA